MRRVYAAPPAKSAPHAGGPQYAPTRAGSALDRQRLWGDHAPMKRPILCLALTVALTAAACGPSGITATPTAPASPAAARSSSGSTAPGSSAQTTPAASLGPAKPVWLGRPGLANNPGAGNLDATALDANGKHTALPASPAAD